MTAEDTSNETKTPTEEKEVKKEEKKYTTNSLLHEFSLFWDPTLGPPDVNERRRFIDLNRNGSFFELPHLHVDGDRLIFISWDYLRDIPYPLPE